MHAGQVIALKIIVHIGLPVALHVVSAALEQLHRGKGKLLRLPRQLAQTLAQGPRLRIKVHEHQVEPFLGMHRLQSEVCGTKSVHPFDFGGAEQSAVEAISPAVISAAKQFARTAAFCRRSGPVPTNVIETSHSSIEPAHQYERLAYELGGEIVARIRDLAGVADHLPGAREYFFFSASRTLASE